VDRGELRGHVSAEDLEVGLKARAAFPTAALVLVLARAAAASFHLAVIDEVVTRVDGDAGQQYVEIRMLAPAQGMVRNSVLAAFDAEGAYVADVLVVPGDVPRAGAGIRWMMATEAFQQAQGFAADFTIPAGILPLEDGMICWGAPGVMPPDPASWDHTDPSRYVDCVAYGRFCGLSPGGAPADGTPADHALARTAAAAFVNRDFVCASTLAPRNNAGVETAIAGAPCTSTGAYLCGRALAGGPPARTDCLGGWVVAGAPSARAVVRCRDGNPACDRGTGEGCLVRTQLCFGRATKACTPAPVTAVDVRGPQHDQADRANATQVTLALEALGGVQDGTRVGFTPPLATPVCTAPFQVLVPRGRPARRLRVVTHGGRTDKDALTLMCGS